MEKEFCQLDLYSIELECQMGDDFKLNYTPINKILKIVEGIEELGLTKTQVASLMSVDKDHIEHELELYKLMKECLEEHGTPNEWKLLSKNKVTYSHFDDMYNQFLSPKRAPLYEPLDLADAKKIAFKLLWLEEGKLGHKEFRHFPEIMKEDRIRQTFLDGAKRNEETGEEYDANSVLEMFERAKDQVRTQKNSYKPEKLLTSIKDGLERLDEILDNNALLKKPNSIRIMNDILRFTKNIEEFRDKNQNQTESEEEN